MLPERFVVSLTTAPHMQRERGKVIGVGIHTCIYVYIQAFLKVG